MLSEKKKKKKAKKEWRRYVALLDAHMTKLLYDEMKFEARMRNKALRLARKRKPRDYIT